jgi:hypothetical protein
MAMDKAGDNFDSDSGGYYGSKKKTAPSAKAQWESHEAGIDAANDAKAKKAYNSKGGWAGELRRSSITDEDRERHTSRQSEAGEQRTKDVGTRAAASQVDWSHDGGWDGKSWGTSAPSAPSGSDRSASPRRRFGSILGHFKR